MSAQGGSTVFKKNRCTDGVTCVVLCVACTLSSIYLVCGVLVLPSLHPSIYFENVFHTCLCAFLLYHSTIQEPLKPLVCMYDSVFVEEG